MNILVTGGSRGMGHAFALMALAKGHGVVTMQRGKADLPCPSVYCDLSASPHDVKAATREAIAIFDDRRLDALVLAGGMGAYMGWQDYDAAKHEEMMRVHYYGPLLVFRTCARRLMRKHVEVPCPNGVATNEPRVEPAVCWQCGGTREAALDVEHRAIRVMADERGPSRVLWLGSTVTGGAGASGLEDYAGTKGAVQGAFPSLARHYRRWGIRMVDFATSWVDTPMTRAIRARNPKLYRRILDHCPLGRMATEQEAAEAMLFLVEGPEYFHGCRVEMHGGAG